MHRCFSKALLVAKPPGMQLLKGKTRVEPFGGRQELSLPIPLYIPLRFMWEITSLIDRLPFASCAAATPAPFGDPVGAEPTAGKAENFCRFERE